MKSNSELEQIAQYLCSNHQKEKPNHTVNFATEVRFLENVATEENDMHEAKRESVDLICFEHCSLDPGHKVVKGIFCF